MREETGENGRETKALVIRGEGKTGEGMRGREKKLTWESEGRKILGRDIERGEHEHQ